MANEDEAGALRKLYQELQAEHEKLKTKNAATEAELERYRNAFVALRKLTEVIQAPITPPTAHCEFCPGVDKPHGPHEEDTNK